MNQQKSFTLIELLVVIAIIGLLSSVVLVSMQGTREKAKIAKSLEFSQTVQHVLGVNAVGWWSFETIEQPGDKVIDGSGYGNDGTVTGATLVPATPGLEQLGNALSFDGNDYVNCGSGGSLNLTSAITIEAWVKTNNVSGSKTIYDRKYSNSRGQYWLEVDKPTQGKILLRILNSNGTTLTSIQTNSAVFNPNTWAHIVATYNSSLGIIYVNGILVKSVNTGNLGVPSANGPSAIGALWYGGYTGFFNGLIDEVRIYSQALSATEIQKHYVEGLENHRDLVLK